MAAMTEKASCAPTVTTKPQPPPPDMRTGLFDPNTPGQPLSAARAAARKLMTPAQLWPITTIERRLGRPMTEQEERITVEHARWAGTV
jgi:hypothetical protein